MMERQELYCHECDQYIQFNMDLGLDGCHTIRCPNCGHLHYRVTQDGKSTSERWKSSQNQYQVSIRTITSTGSSTFATYTGSATDAGTNSMFYGSWSDTTGGY
jgi:4-hydroxy-3-methylbut-2-en-1-yl diphosphate synthase IspG/GcpE